MSEIKDVIVIGCGASGIAALRKLHDAGLKVLGLEAADRIGGRILTVEHWGGAVDLGAAWCHGEKDNIVFELANPLNLLGRPDPDNRWYLQSDGELLDSKSAEEIEKTISNAVTTADKNNSKSILQCVKDATTKEKSLQNDPKLTNSFLEWFERNNHLGGQNDPKQGKSLRGLVECWNCEGEFMLNWKGKGYKTILDVLLKKYPDPSKEIPVKIMLNKEVSTIKWKAKESGFDAGNPVVQVKCKDGSLFLAKSVIVTVSVGVLKERHSSLFDPLLPIEKINTINNLQLCVLGKIYIEFAKPWWPKSPANFTILWSPEDKEKIPKEDKWITEIFGLNTVEYQPNMLLAWTYGNGAIEMENTTLQKVEEGVKKFMKLIFEKHFDVTPVKFVLRSQWASNPLTRCAYAYRSVANEENGGDAITLSEPLCHESGCPLVCFAGEATSHHRHTAVHGAIEAGFREADRLIKFYKK